MLLVVALLVGTTLGLLILNTAIAVDSLKATQLRAENAERAQELQRSSSRWSPAARRPRSPRAAEAAGLVPAGPAAYLVIEPRRRRRRCAAPPHRREPRRGEPAEDGD